MALKSANQPIRWKERIGTVVIGHSVKQAEEYFFSYIAYPAAIAYFGSVVGGVLMTTLSAFVCYLYLVFYDWAKKDWFGFEAIKEIRDGESTQGRLAKWGQAFARKGDLAAFVFWSSVSDPFMTTLYLRKGAGNYNGMSRRDWAIFWSSVLVSNVGWTLIVFAVVELFRAVLKILGFV